jgi:hypothetical protein
MHSSQRTCSLGVVFSEGVERRLRFWLDRHSCVKMAALQFYHQSAKQRKVGWVGRDIHVVFGVAFLCVAFCS